MMLELSLSSARIAGENCTLLLARDITERKITEQQLKYLSLHDTLTGLHNRAGFEHYREQMDAEGPFPVAVIMADLDGLKEVNDGSGHEAGDQLITAAAALLKAPFRAQDIVARIGGDEFALLLPGMEESIARAKLGRLRQRIALHAELPDVPPVSLSLGMAFANGPGQLHGALSMADQQMYTEKQAKKGPLQGNPAD